MASRSSKPVVLLVHGAWHTPGHYHLLIKALQAAGHTVIAPPLATAGPSDLIVGKGVPDDLARLEEAIGPHIESGKEIILVAHSYGGFPGTYYVKDRTAAERKARGLEGGFVAAVYIAAYAPAVAGEQPSRHKPVVGFFDVDVSRLFSTPVPGSPKVADPNRTTRETLYSLLGGHSGLAFAAEVTVGASELAVPKTYLVCTRDDCVPAEFQREVAEGMGARVIDIDAGHSPFLVESHVERMVREIGTATERN
ncbi:Alpha/beta hydrolase fold-1 [Microdochium bolleyi]|uniref:Alpha/beta hydrolase fold-1 n=1 Tax=Microdochium bolleyi TaxID=196109 RepID=A0A136IK45_9PEZI|nr:Alpha/beta hydrolase fold-1 [Microdochium bolleyi]